MLDHISLSEAVDIISKLPVALSIETLSLENSLDRILAEDIYAQIQLPPFKKSPFDGFAIRSSDLPGDLKIIGTIAAGTKDIIEIGPKEAVKIFTGAPVPDTADVVVRSEDVQLQGDIVKIQGPFSSGTNIIIPGEDVKNGDLLIKKGTRLQPSHLGIIAGQGISRLKVYQKPKAYICPTGTELSEPGETCGPFGIYNSSTSVISSYLKRIGFYVSRSHIIPDDYDRIRETVKDAFETGSDIVFTTGGASIGDYDYALSIAKDLGAEILFWKVRIKPGGALLVSRLGNKMLVSLSGNPAAAIMSLLVTLRPWLYAVTGSPDRAERITLPLKEDMPKTSRATRLLRGHLDFDDGKVFFAENDGRGNGNIASFESCDLIGVISGDMGPLKKGDMIEILKLPPELC